MEQSRGPIIPPAHTVGTDPAYIPGLTSSPPAGPAKKAPDTAPEQTTGQPPEDAVPEETAEPAELSGTEAQSDTDQPSGPGDVPEEARAGEENEGPVFAVSDRRGSITADRTGITLRLDDEMAEFGWDEIGAVEFDTARFARRFSLTVHTIGRRRYEADVAAPSRPLLKQWTAELDAVLDARFDDAKP